MKALLMAGPFLYPWCVWPGRAL